MKEDKNFYIIDKNVLPEIFIKVMEVKNLLESGRERTVQDAVNTVGISRSAFYKYRDAIFPLYEHSRGKNVTFSVTFLLQNRLFCAKMKAKTECTSVAVYQMIVALCPS